MDSSFALRYVRRLTTAVSSASKPITISYTRNKLKRTSDPDTALKIYSSFTSANNSSDHPSSVRHALETTVRLLAKSHRFSEIEALIESHKSLPQFTQESLVSSIIRAYGIAGMCKNSINIYEQMTEFGTPRSSLSFNSLLHVCLQCKLYDRVPVYFNEFPAKFGFLPDKFSYGILVKAYCSMGSPEMAMEKLNEMEEKGIEIGAIAFTPILHLLYRMGRIEDAAKFWDDMVTKKGRLPDVGSYNVRLMHIHRGEIEGVKDLIEEMVKSGIKPDTISYNYLMSCYCVNGMMVEAHNVYDELTEKGCKPNSATFRTLVFHLCKHGRFMTGYKVFKVSVKENKIPDFNTLKYLIEGLVNKGHVREAKGMVRTMNKKFPPQVLKAWGKLVDDLGLVVGVTDSKDSGGQEKVICSDDTEKVAT